MDFIDHIDLKQVGKIIVVEKIIFRDSFYENFQKLFLEGYIDTTILPESKNNNVRIRFSNFRTREEVIQHIEKLKAYYDVQMFPGVMNFDTGKIIHTLEYNYDYVRIFPEEPMEYNDGFHGIHKVYIIGVLKNSGDFSDDDFDDKKIEKNIKSIIAKASKANIKDVKTIE